MTQDNPKSDSIDYSRNIPKELYEVIYGLTEAVADTKKEAKLERQKIFKSIDRLITLEIEKARIEQDKHSRGDELLWCSENLQLTTYSRNRLTDHIKALQGDKNEI